VRTGVLGKGARAPPSPRGKKGKQQREEKREERFTWRVLIPRLEAQKNRQAQWKRKKKTYTAHCRRPSLSPARERKKDKARA